MVPDVDTPCHTQETASKKCTPSYIAMISMAILNSPEKRMLLSDIYQWISLHYPAFRSEDRSWRNSIRHNLSLNECFVKSGRSECGKGHFWSIHPANVADFSCGDYRRRRARRLVKQSDDETRRHRPTHDTFSEAPPLIGDSAISTDATNFPDCRLNGYVPMSVSYVPMEKLISMVGCDACMTKDQQKQRELSISLVDYSQQFCAEIGLDIYENVNS